MSKANAKVQSDCLNYLVQVPANGLVIYTGTVMTDDGKEKKMSMAIEPFKPINISLYLCDSKFHTEVRTSSSLRAAAVSASSSLSPYAACLGKCRVLKAARDL